MRQLKCSGCGVVNRVEAHSFRAAPICGRCRTRLPEPLLNPVLRGAWRGKFWGLLAIVIALSLLGALGIHPGLEPLPAPAVPAYVRPVPAQEEAVAAAPAPVSPQAAPEIPHAPAAPLIAPAPALPLPPTGTGHAYVRARRDHWIDVRVKDGPYSNTLVRVYRASDNAIVAERFIRSGGRLKIQLPAGMFVVRSASGQDWYGYERYFGEATEFSEAQAVVDMREDGTYYDLRLIPEVNGNLDRKSIAREQF